MGRRKIEIKAIKDERNRSVTFLKRKHGLFKKAHELSVLCSADVAVIIFGSNKKLFEYSSRDLREMISRWSYHGPPHEHKGPADFNGGGDDDDDDDENGTPPQTDGIEAHVFASHAMQGMQPQFPHIRHHTPSASPPIPNGVFHPANGARGHTPQPQMGSRPSSRNDIRRAGPAMVGQPVGPPGSQPPAVNGFAYMQQPAMYNAQNPANMPPPIPHGLPQQIPPQHPQYPYPQPQPQPHQMQPYVDEQRRASGPPAFPPQPQGPPVQRHSVSPPQPHAALPPQPVPHMSPPPPQSQQVHPMHSPPQHQQHLPPPPPPPPPSHEPPIIIAPPQDPHPPAPLEPEQKPRPPPVERARQTLLLDTNIKKQPQRKGGSIFTPIDEHKSVLMQHISVFHPEVKSEAASSSSRSQSLDAGNSSVIPRAGGNANLPQRPSPPRQPLIQRNGSLGSIPDAGFTPPSRSNSMQLSAGSTRPRLKVQIPDESDGGSATADSTSPRATATTTTSTDMTSQPSRGGGSGGRGGLEPQQQHPAGNNVMQLPPPSPSASALPASDTLLSAGATGPPNPFARPLPQHQNNNNGNNPNNTNPTGNPTGPNRTGNNNDGMNIDTPVSALPSRFLGTDFLPSPSSFYPEWGFRSGADSNTLPSPLNFATPVVGTGPSFLRDEPGHPGVGHPLKRKSPEIGNNGNHGGGNGGGVGGAQHHRLEPMEVGGAVGGDVKRLRVD